MVFTLNYLFIETQSVASNYAIEIKDPIVLKKGRKQ